MIHGLSSSSFLWEPLIDELGDKFNGFVEVKSGLKAGQIYAAGNSYLLKAELGKSGATHDH